MANSLSFDDLNDAQRRAVRFPMEPLLVLAGPGTGKTRTLVSRIRYLIEHYNLRAEQILAVTYTNKATEEMRQRLYSALSDAAREMTVGTFHGFCIRILRAHHDVVALPKHFTIADEDMQIEVLSRVMRNLAPESRIQTLKTMLGKLSHFRLNHCQTDKPLSNFEKQVLTNYQAELKKNCLIDFDDILLLTHELLIKDALVLSDYRNRFAAILIDEFQDTDKIQYEIIKLLAHEHRNVFAVADDDQSIFSWRGAHPQNVHDFRGDFAGENVINLDNNYRSTEEIVAQADRLICNNPRLVVKNITSVSGPGSQVRFHRFENETEEASFLINEIRGAMEKNSELTYGDFAALFPRHSIGENLEQEFMKANIPCQLVRGESILGHEEIEKAMLLLRLICNPDDQITLEKFVRREMGDLAFTQLKEMQALQTDLDFKAALVGFGKLDSVSQQDRLRANRIISNIRNLIDFTNVSTDQCFSGLVAEIISCVSEWKLSLLQNVAEDISDPMGYPGIIDAAQSFRDAVRNQSRILVSGSNVVVRFIAARLVTEVFPTAHVTEHEIGTEIADSAEYPLYLALDAVSYEAIRKTSGQVIYAGSTLPDNGREVASDSNHKAFVLSPYNVPLLERGFEPSVTAIVFKLCQAAACLDQLPFLADYTAIDIETTDLDVRTNEIIELAAVRVRSGQPVEDYNLLIKPSGPISPDAQKVHGITAEMLERCGSFTEIISDFLEFIDNDVLVAHNGDEFDFKCIKNRLKDCGRAVLSNRTFDTLPFARRLFPGKGAGIDALASRFNLDTGHRHRALDDTKCLVQIFERLKREHDSRQRATSHESCMDIVALGILIEHGKLYDRDALLIKFGTLMLDSPNSKAMLSLRERFPEMRTDEIDKAINTISQEHHALGLVSHEAFNLRSRLDEIVARFDDRPLKQAIQDFLDFASMYQKQDGLERRNAVTLMTIHAAKGLEFRNVFVVGMEQGQIPSYYAVKSNNPDDIKEQRRLLYVAITRAEKQLILTGVASRDGRLQQHSQFLRELELDYDFTTETSESATGII
ncbi:MAG TPA: UvrD-helicase domain-containing protein [Blastocatellia bacterium]|nr:UvrD-helicase domain-containing protein [Blastocatellia bacterium]